MIFIYDWNFYKYIYFFLLLDFRFDIYRKIPKDLTQPTTTGAAISLICVSFITTLLLTEFYYFITPDV